MADASSTVELIFQGVDRTSEATQAALRNTQQFSQSVQAIAAPIADATEKAIKFEAAIIGASIALVAFSINEAAKFQTAALSLAKVLDTEVDPALEVFTSKAREMAAEYGVASISVLDSITNFKKAGFEAAETFDLTRTALDAVIAGEVELTSASDRLVAALKGFGAEAGDAATIVDLLNAAANRYAVTFDELLTGFSNFSPIAKNANLTFEETVGVLVPVIEVFRSGSEAGNALQTSFLRLQSDTGSVTAALGQLGVSQFDLNGELRSARDIYFDVATALQDVDGNQKTYLASQLVGIRQSAKFLAATDNLAKTLEIAGGEFEYIGSAAQEVEIVLGSAEKQVDRAGVAFRGIFQAIGEPLLDQFGDLAGALRAIFGAITDSVGDEEQLGGLVRYVESLMGDLTRIFEDVAKNLPGALAAADLSGFQRNIEGVLDGVRRLLSGIDLTTEDGLKKLIEGVGEGLARLGILVGDAIAVFGPLLNALIRVAETIVSVDEKWFELAGTIGGISIVLDRVLPKLDSLLLLFIAARGFGIKGGATAAAGSVAALGLNLKTLAGIIGAGGVGYAIGSVLVPALDSAIDRMTGSGSLGGAIFDLEQRFTNSTTGISGFANLIAGAILNWADSTDDLGDATRRAEAELAAMDLRWGTVEENTRKAEEATRRAAEQYGTITDNTEEANEALRDFAATQGFVILESGRWVELKKPISEIAPAIQDADDAARGWIQTIVDGVPTFTQVGSAAGAAFDEAAAAAAEAERKSESYLLKMEEIASNERIRLIEAKVTLNVAEIEADTKRVEAAFSSITSTISDSYKLLGELFGLLGETDRFNENRILRQIEEENRRLDQQLDLQKRLTEAQIDKIYADIRAAERGDALIQVDGAGLQPHLEAFMWEILRTIQVRVNQDGLEMLLGTA